MYSLRCAADEWLFKPTRDDLRCCLGRFTLPGMFDPGYSAAFMACVQRSARGLSQPSGEKAPLASQDRPENFVFGLDSGLLATDPRSQVNACWYSIMHRAVSVLTFVFIKECRPLYVARL